MKLTIRSKRVQAFAVLWICLTFDSRLSYVPIDMSCVCSRLSYVPIDMSCVCSRLLFDAQRQTERLAECSVPIPPWVVIASSAFSDVAWLSDLVDSLRACAFLYGDPDGERRDGGTRDTENRVGGAAEERFCVTALALLCFPRGVRWGCAPQTAPKSHWLSGLSSFGS